jgi:hypothetical protein
MELLIPSHPSLDGEGTSESTWLAWHGLSEVPRWDPVPASSGRVIVVAPHPDDEILGAGGTVAQLVARGAEHIAVAVTDGEASHPMRGHELGRTRPLESDAAATRLGISAAMTHRLGQPDGGVKGLPVPVSSETSSAQATSYPRLGRAMDTQTTPRWDSVLELRVPHEAPHCCATWSGPGTGPSRIKCPGGGREGSTSLRTWSKPSARRCSAFEHSLKGMTRSWRRKCWPG